MKTDLFICILWTGHFVSLDFKKFAQDESQKVNKHPKFDANFDIWRQFEHFEYDMNCILE